MNSPRTARRGVFAGVAGMALAILGTLLLTRHRPTGSWIVVARSPSASWSACRSRWVPLTAVPQRTALSHAFGGLAAGLVGTAKYYLWLGDEPGQPHRLPA